MLQTLLLLAAFQCIWQHLKGSKRVYVFGAGLFSGFAFITYVPSYAPISALLLMLVGIRLLDRHAFRSVLREVLLFGAGAAIPVLLMEGGARILGHSYLYSLWEYGQSTLLSIPPASRFDGMVFPNAVRNAGGALQLWILAAGLVYALFHALVTRNRASGLLAGFCVISGSLFFLMAWQGTHTHFDVHYVFLLPFLALACGLLFSGLERVLSRYTVIACLLIFSILALQKASLIIENTFKIAPMTQWLEQQGIQKSKITTNLDIREKGDVDRAVPIPVSLVHHPCDHFAIDWKSVEALYREKGIRYLLTSGIGSITLTGYRDSALEEAGPVKTWLHPVHYTEPETENVQDFLLYNLEDIFDGGERAGPPDLLESVEHPLAQETDLPDDGPTNHP